MKSSVLRFSRGHWICGAALVATLSFGLIGCGGGGGGGSSNRTPTPQPTFVAGSCDATTYTPNYAPAVTLLHWTGFPLRVFFVQDAQYTAARQSLTLAGFDRWVAATGGRATYTVVNTASDADFKVSFFRFTGGSGDTLGTTTVTYNNQGVIQSSTMNIGITGDNPTDVETAAHEYGHNIGISGHSPNSADLMYFTGNASGNVTTSDLNTVRTAYCDVFPARSNRVRQQDVGPLHTVVLH